MNRAYHLILVAAVVIGVLAIGAMLDGPSDIEAEQAVAADLQDATAQASREAHQVRVELKPAEMLQQYALLEGEK